MRPRRFTRPTPKPWPETYMTNDELVALLLSPEAKAIIARGRIDYEDYNDYESEVLGED